MSHKKDVRLIWVYEVLTKLCRLGRVIWHQNHAAKSVAYTTMVRPRLEYSSTVWDPHLASDVHTLEQVQRQAARFVHRNYTQRTPGCVTNMVQSPGWESLQQRRNMDRLSMVFKIQHGIIDISPEFIQPGDSRTRGSQRIQQLQANKDVYRYSFYRLEQSAYINHQQFIHPGTQRSPSLPASLTPLFLGYALLTKCL